jgi:signal transduction histidine kinase
VSDDGKGFDVQTAKARAAHGATLGLLSLNERAAFAGGRTRITSSPGKGATVDILLPVDSDRCATEGIEGRQPVDLNSPA